MKLLISEMFDELIRLGHITPDRDPRDLKLPGAYDDVPSVIAYGTPNIPVNTGVHTDAKLEQRASRDLDLSDRAQ
jgi:hypothetical protein